MNRPETPKEPTGEECNLDLEVPVPPGWEPGWKAFACWYPQMGGYCGKAVVLVHGQRNCNCCFEVYVWHDGSFPFKDENPAHLHHCDSEQFIEFGQLVDGKRDEYFPKPREE